MDELEEIKKQPGIIATRDNPKLVEKWKPILEHYGIKDPYKLKWMAQYCETHLKIEAEMRRLGISQISEEVQQLLHPTNDVEYTEIKDSKQGIFKRIVKFIKSVFKK